MTHERNGKNPFATYVARQFDLIPHTKYRTVKQAASAAARLTQS